jgi:hypothetical protein
MSSCAAPVTKIIGVLAMATIAAVVTSCSRSDPRTPEEATARGRERVQAMADVLRKAQAFSFDTSEVNERVRRNGEKVAVKVERNVIVRRPDRLSARVVRPEGEHMTWYDGKTITLVVPGDKVFARCQHAADSR